MESIRKAMNGRKRGIKHATIGNILESDFDIILLKLKCIDEVMTNEIVNSSRSTDKPLW